MHLINSYEEKFEFIDEIIIYLNYENDLQRAFYTPNEARISMLSSTIFKLRDNIKLLSYGSKIGILEPFKKMVLENTFPEKDAAYMSNRIEQETQEERDRKDMEYLNNFKSLIELYGFDKTKTTLLLDSRKTSAVFMDFCKSLGFRYIDFSKSFEETNRPTNLIYDYHWNDHGRDLIAAEIAKHIKEKNKKILDDE